MDVKVGSGAVMPTYELSEALAGTSLTSPTARACAPLPNDGHEQCWPSAGNAVEVVRACSPHWRIP